MYIHLSYPQGVICGSTDLEISTSILELVDCPECAKIIRQAATKLHQRRRKNNDMIIIRRVLVDNHSKLNTSPEDWESYSVRLRELEEEVNQFNPENPKESYIMSLIAQECEVENVRS